jgi:hypothetical protein
VDVVVARYCENLSWLQGLPAHWRVTVYDKSRGGPRQREVRGVPIGPSGPNAAALWPGAVALTNVGGEANSYCEHVIRRWGKLARHTLFLQGDPICHRPTVIDEARRLLHHGTGPDFHAFGPNMACRMDGRPHHPGLVELEQLYLALFRDEPPPVLAFQPWALFVASRKRLRSVPLATWTRARDVIQTKGMDCAMERLWARLLG